MLCLSWSFCKMWRREVQTGRFLRFKNQSATLHVNALRKNVIKIYASAILYSCAAERLTQNYFATFVKYSWFVGSYTVLLNKIKMMSSEKALDPALWVKPFSCLVTGFLTEFWGNLGFHSLLGVPQKEDWFWWKFAHPKHQSLSLQYKDQSVHWLWSETGTPFMWGMTGQGAAHACWLSTACLWRWSEDGYVSIMEWGK